MAWGTLRKEGAPLIYIWLLFGLWCRNPMIAAAHGDSCTELCTLSAIPQKRIGIRLGGAPAKCSMVYFAAILYNKNTIGRIISRKGGVLLCVPLEKKSQNYAKTER